jgi:hypothetical protein
LNIKMAASVAEPTIALPLSYFGSNTLIGQSLGEAGLYDKKLDNNNEVHSVGRPLAAGVLHRVVSPNQEGQAPALA